MLNQPDALELFAFFSLLAGIILLLVNLALAIGVSKDARLRYTSGGRVMFASNTVWFWAVLIGSFPAVALYWVMHHSSLRAVERS